MRKIAFILVLMLVFGTPQRSNADELCTIDVVPSATLLLPFFSVQYGDATRTTTIFSINNSTASPALAHVVLWTDYSVPTIDFHVYLTGFDTQEINVRDLFLGRFPQTSSSLNAAGNASNPNTDFTNCSGFLPPDALTSSEIDAVRNAHTGRASTLFSNECGGRSFDDSVASFNRARGIARGYITIDNVDSCSSSTPASNGYFGDGGTGIASNSNALWGDYFHVDPASNFATGDNLVHIQSDGNAQFVNTDYTFYGRYVSADSSDDREPAATVHAMRYVGTSDSIFDGGTVLRVWRDSGLEQDPFTCNSSPAYFPLGHGEIVAFDEQENSMEIDETDSTPFPAEANFAVVGTGSSADVTVPFESGWLYLNLNTTVTGAEYGAFKQSHVHGSWINQLSVGFEAIQFDSACNPINTTVIP